MLTASAWRWVSAPLLLLLNTSSLSASVTAYSVLPSLVIAMFTTVPGMPNGAVAQPVTTPSVTHPSWLFWPLVSCLSLPLMPELKTAIEPGPPT